MRFANLSFQQYHCLADAAVYFFSFVGSPLKRCVWLLSLAVKDESLLSTRLRVGGKNGGNAVKLRSNRFSYSLLNPFSTELETPAELKMEMRACVWFESAAVKVRGHRA